MLIATSAFAFFLVGAGPAGTNTTAWYSQGQFLSKGTFERKTPKTEYHPSHVLVAFNPNRARAFAAKNYGLELDKNIRSPYFACYNIVRPGLSVEAAVRALSADPSIRLAEPDFKYHLAQTVPNDPSFGDLWGLYNTGQLGGLPGADIDILNAWKVQKGKPSVKVAVIDTGVDYTHPDLAANILKTSGGAVIGYDFYANDADPMDEHGHGTHCSGTIAGVRNNGIGVAGVAPGVKIMPMRFLGPDGSGYTSGAISCIDYARGKGAKIMSNSWAGYGFSRLLLESIERAADADILFVAAAGNDGMNVDDVPVFPSGYNTIATNILSVAATDRFDTIAGFSNWGNTVDLAAPGVDVLSTTPGNTYSVFSGTSMATPHVSGAAALVFSKYPTLHVSDVKNRLVSGCDHLAGLLNHTKGSGRLNATNALDNDTTPPGAVTDLHATMRSSSAVSYAFTSPGDDGTTGKVAWFDVRTSSKAITAANFDKATPVATNLSNVNAGSTARFAVSGMLPNVKVFCAIRAYDNVGNFSAIYSAPSVKTVTAPWYDNVEGAAMFTGVGFSVTNEDHVSGAQSWTDSPGGNYVENTTATLTQTTSYIATGPVFLYASLNYALEPGYDYLTTEVSYNNGATWSTVNVANGFSLGWKPLAVYLPAASNNQLKVRFTMTSDSSVDYDGVHIDDIRYVPATSILYDNVESSGKFTAVAPFTTTNAQYVSPTHSWTDSAIGNYLDNANTTITSTSAIDGSGLLPAFVNFQSMYSTELGFDYLNVEVSQNGGSTWLPVGKLSGTSTVWAPVGFDISNTTRNVQYRFHFISDATNEADGVYLDDIGMVGEPGIPVP